MNATDLVPGDLLLEPGNRTVRVDGSVRYSENHDVYNLTVEDLHTYFVRLGTRGSVLVHNANCPLKPGEAGSSDELSRRGVRGDGITPHHMPQAAAEFTTYGEGGALSMEQAEHELTRTFGGRGIRTLREDADVAFRDVLAKDMRDVRSIVGGRYNAGLRDLLSYYKDNFPELMTKGAR